MSISVKSTDFNWQVSPTLPELTRPPSSQGFPLIKASQQPQPQTYSRKRKKKTPSTESNKSSKKASISNEPMFGVSNAYFLTQPPPLKTILENATKQMDESSAKSDTLSISSLSPTPPISAEKLIKEIPNLLSQV